MLIIADLAAMARALASPIDPALKQLLALRRDQLSEFDFDELARFLVVEPKDALAIVEAELGFSPLTNLVDGSRYGERDFEPSFEWVLNHGDLYECPFVLSDDGFGWVLIVPDRDGVDPQLLSMLRAYAVKETAEPGAS